VGSKEICLCSIYTRMQSARGNAEISGQGPRRTRESSVVYEISPMYTTAFGDTLVNNRLMLVIGVGDSGICSISMRIVPADVVFNSRQSEGEDAMTVGGYA